MWKNKGKKTMRPKHKRITVHNRFKRQSRQDLRRDNRDVTSYNNDPFDVASPLSTHCDSFIRIMSQDQNSYDISPTLGKYREEIFEEVHAIRRDNGDSCPERIPIEYGRRVEIYRREEHKKNNEEKRSEEYTSFRGNGSNERRISDHVGYDSSGIKENASRNNQRYIDRENESRENSYEYFQNERWRENDEYQMPDMGEGRWREESSERLQGHYAREDKNHSHENLEERKDNEYKYYIHEERMMREISNERVIQRERMDAGCVQYAEQCHGETMDVRSHEDRNTRDEIDLIRRGNHRYGEQRTERHMDEYSFKTDVKDTFKRAEKYSENKQMTERKNMIDSPEQANERDLRKTRDKQHRQRSTRHKNDVFSHRSFLKLCVGKKEDIVSDIMSACIQSGNEHLSLRSLSDITTKSKSIKFKSKSDLLEVLKEFPNCFLIDSDKRVTASTDVLLCYEKKCDCEKLHICKFDLRDACQFGDSCEFGHALHSKKNADTLRKHYLHRMHDNYIKALLRFVGHQIIPSLCIYYRKGICSKGNKCTRLHLCLNYIKEDCRYGDRCMKSHSLQSEQAGNILRQYGLHEKDERNLLKLIRGTLDENGNIKVDSKAPLATKAKASESKKRKLEDTSSEMITLPKKYIKTTREQQLKNMRNPHEQNETWENADDVLLNLNTIKHEEKDMESDRDTIPKSEGEFEAGQNNSKGNCSQACSDSGNREKMHKAVHNLDFIPLSPVSDCTMDLEDGENSQSDALTNDLFNQNEKSVKASSEDKEKCQSVFAHHLINLSKKSKYNNRDEACMSKYGAEKESCCSDGDSNKTKFELPENDKDDKTVEETLKSELGNNSEHADKTADTKLVNESTESSDSNKDIMDPKARDADINETKDFAYFKDKNDYTFNDSIAVDNFVQPCVSDRAAIDLPDKPSTLDVDRLNSGGSEKKEITEPCASAMPEEDINVAEQVDVKLTVGSEEYILRATKTHLELKTGQHSRTFTDKSVLQSVANLLEFCKQNHK